MAATDQEIASGTNRDFSFTIQTSAPDRIWKFWTDPATWGDWDQGLKSASMQGSMHLGSTGQITPLSGPTSKFKVVSFDAGQSYAFETRLPMASLHVARSFNPDRSAFTHHITFRGPLAFAFARMFGPGFRRALPPTMRKLADLSEQS
ncbi:SRPBCC family protein [Tabrizicola sp.]|uniref:SRPBCC family protein n=1 Tax=Tabrizicola sp. TaxID=2005166 RepID=UPI003F3F2A86